MTTGTYGRMGPMPGSVQAKEEREEAKGKRKSRGLREQKSERAWEKEGGEAQKENTLPPPPFVGLGRDFSTSSPLLVSASS